jgi:hypothetical protein
MPEGRSFLAVISMKGKGKHFKDFAGGARKNHRKLAVVGLLLLLTVGVTVGVLMYPLPQSRALPSIQLAVGGPAVSIGTYMQNWEIRLDGPNGPVYHASADKPGNLLVMLLAMESGGSSYNPNRFYTVHASVPVSYTGGLTYTDSHHYSLAVIQGSVKVLIENVRLADGKLISFELGSSKTYGVQFKGGDPPGTLKHLEFWMTNTEAYHTTIATQVGDWFATDIEAGLEQHGLGLSTSFTLSAIVTETVSIFDVICGTGPLHGGDCTNTKVDQNSDSLKMAIAWSPPVTLTTQYTSQYTANTQVLGCQGATCSLVATQTGTITQATLIRTTTDSSGRSTTETLTQEPTTWTNTINITVTQHTQIGPSGDFCKDYPDSWFCGWKWPTLWEWLTGSTFGIPNIVWIIIVLVVLYVIVKVVGWFLRPSYGRW